MTDRYEIDDKGDLRIPGDCELPGARSMSMDACEILHTAEICIGDRASSRDLPDGERSMARTVSAFNALTGHRLAATPGGRHNADDYVDMCAYAALTGECAERVA